LTIFTFSLHLATSKANISPGAKVDGTAYVGNFATIFNNAEVQAGASVGGFTTIREYAKILRGSSVGMFSTVNARSIIGKQIDNYVTIGPDVTVNGIVGSYSKVDSGSNIGDAQVGQYVQIGAKVTVMQNAQLLNYCGLSNGVTIGNGDVIGMYTQINQNCVVGNNTTMRSYIKIDRNTEIGSNVFIDNYASIGLLSKIKNGVLIDQYASLGAKAVVFDLVYVGKYVQLGNGVNVGTGAVIHQYTTIPQSYKVLENQAVINPPSSQRLFNIIMQTQCSVSSDYLNASDENFSSKMLDWMNTIFSNALKQCQAFGNFGSYQLGDFPCLVRTYLTKYYGANAFNAIYAKFYTDPSIQQQLNTEIHFGKNPKKQILSKDAVDTFVILLTAYYDVARDLRISGDTKCSMLSNLINKKVIVDVVDVPFTQSGIVINGASVTGPGLNFGIYGVGNTVITPGFSTPGTVYTSSAVAPIASSISTTPIAPIPPIPPIPPMVPTNFMGLPPGFMGSLPGFMNAPSNFMGPTNFMGLSNFMRPPIAIR